MRRDASDPGGLGAESHKAWRPSPRSPTLESGEVHAWRVAIDVPASDPSVLSAEERARADRFRADRDRSRFLASHAALRMILGACAGCRAEEIAFEVGVHGKPVLAGPSGTGIEFNLSHSGEHAVVAVARGRRVGVDIEEIRPIAERGAIIARFLSARERADLAALPEPLSLDGFFRAWTCKESYIKAIGTGLVTTLDSFSVAVDPREPPALLEVAGDPEEASRWSIRELKVGSGYAGAVMAEGTDWELRCYIAEGTFTP